MLLLCHFPSLYSLGCVKCSFLRKCAQIEAKSSKSALAAVYLTSHSLSLLCSLHPFFSKASASAVNGGTFHPLLFPTSLLLSVSHYTIFTFTFQPLSYPEVTFTYPFHLPLSLSLSILCIFNCPFHLPFSPPLSISCLFHCPFHFPLSLSLSII